MRSIMYAQGYCDLEKARRSLRALGNDVLARLPSVDYANAEKACPNGLPIGDLMRSVSGMLT